jgi:hypothetical protein
MLKDMLRIWVLVSWGFIIHFKTCVWSLTGKVVNADSTNGKSVNF